MLSIQTSLGSACSILMAVYESGDLEEACMSAACIRSRHRGLVLGMMVWTAIGYTTRTSLVRIESNLNADWYNR